MTIYFVFAMEKFHEFESIDRAVRFAAKHNAEWHPIFCPKEDVMNEEALEIMNKKLKTLSESLVNLDKEYAETQKFVTVGVMIMDEILIKIGGEL